MKNCKVEVSAQETVLALRRVTSTLAGVLAIMMIVFDICYAQGPATPGIYPLPSAGQKQIIPPTNSPAKPSDQTQESEDGTRVVGGAPVTLKEWPSFVLIQYHNRAAGKIGTCGGTVIARDWVLTAAHCVAGKAARNFVVTEGTDNVGKRGRKLGISEIIVHEHFSDNPAPHNDIALLHLSRPARSPAQTLLSGRLPAIRIPTAAVAGFGLTKPQPIEGQHSGELSNQLRQANLPIVSQERCVRMLSNRFGSSISRVVDETTICAGDPAGGRDSCNGDSGGPLSVRSGTGKVQVGVVSWGPGCAQRGVIGVYTAVAHFERWIKRHVPRAAFHTVSVPFVPPVSSAVSQTKPRPQKPLPSAVASIESAATAIGDRAGVHVSLKEGDRISVGRVIHVRVHSPIAGQLIVYNVDLVSGSTYQVFPNRYSGGHAPGVTKLRIAAGTNLTVPSMSDRFSIRVKEPVGRNRLYAFVVPSNVKIDDLAQQGEDMRDLPDPAAFFVELADRALRGVEVIPREHRGVGVYEYEIVK